MKEFDIYLNFKNVWFFTGSSNPLEFTIHSTEGDVTIVFESLKEVAELVMNIESAFDLSEFIEKGEEDET